MHAGALAETPCPGQEGFSFPVGFAQPIMELMLTLEQHRLYLMAEELRSGNLVYKFLI